MIDYAEEKHVIRHFLNDNYERMVELSKEEGDGFVQYRKGVELKKTGDDKEALVYLYSAIMKKYDNPGLYDETAKILHRHGLAEEELNVLEKGLLVVRKGTFYYQKMESNADSIRETIENEG